MKKAIGLLAAIMLLTIGMVSATYTPMWSVDKDVVVTGDYKWDGGAWNLGNYQTATYGFEASGAGMYVTYGESERLGQAWKYNFGNMLSTDGIGTVNSFATIVTVNVPVVTPGTAFTAYAFKTINNGAFTSSDIRVSGNGFALIDHHATFNSAFTSQNFVCVNDCTTT
jgi:hypothetical protein